MNGIIGVINTPFTRDDKIDCDSLGWYVNHGIDAGVAGFLVPAMAGEVDKLTVSERRLIVETVLDAARGSVPVIGGASAPNQELRIYHTKMLNDLGCDGVLVSIPFENEQQFEKNIHAIANLQPGFLMIQDWDFKGYGIPVAMILQLFHDVDVFRCLKVEVVPAGVKYTEVIEATQGRLHVSGGWASSQMIEGLDRGVHAFMSTILPEVYSKVYELHRNGNREAAKRLFHELVPILAFSHQHLDISIHFNKRLANRLGIFSTSKVRKPILPFDKYHERIADELIHTAVELTKSLFD